MAGQRAYLRGLLLVVALACMAYTTHGVTLHLKNNCAKQITVYHQAGAQQTPGTVVLAPKGTKPLNVGASWPAGVVWAGNPNRALAGLAELTILDNGPDTYDISLVNAYNLGIEIQPIKPSGSLCDTISCEIPNLKSFCTPPLKYTPGSDGHSEACTNTDGPQPAGNKECCCPTPSTNKFKKACPDAYSFSKDDKSSTFTCDGTTDYNIVFCPAGKSTNHHLPCTA